MVYIHHTFTIGFSCEYMTRDIYYCIQHMKRRWTSYKNVNPRPMHSFSVKVGNYTKIVPRATKLKFLGENDTTSLPRNRLCPIVSWAIPKAGFKRINKWCCHGKPPSHSNKNNTITRLVWYTSGSFAVALFNRCIDSCEDIHAFKSCV